MAANIFSELKWSGINCELALEFAKDLVWEERFKPLEDQIYVFGKQFHRIKRLENKVNVIIADSPILFSVLYKPEHISDTFSKLILEVHNSFNNLNYFINRKKEYNPIGRMQTANEAVEVDIKTKKILIDNYIKYVNVDGTKEGVNIIVNDILNNLGRMI